MFLTILLYFLGAIFVVVALSGLIGVPCLPTHRKQARKIIELANLKPGQKIIDLGCGHGRLLFLAAKTGSESIGYELNPFLVGYIKIRIFLQKQKNIKIYWRSLFTTDISQADIVVCFLYPNYMKKLQDKLFSEMKPGAKIISYTFPFPEKTHLNKTEGIFVYQV